MVPAVLTSHPAHSFFTSEAEMRESSPGGGGGGGVQLWVEMGRAFGRPTPGYQVILMFITIIRIRILQR